MNKYAVIAGLAVVMVIIGFPIGSYFYLRQGLSFRIDALEALEQSPSEKELTKNLSESVDFVPGNVNVLVNSSRMDEEVLDEVFEKFNGNKYFLLNTLSFEADSTYTEQVADKYLNTRLVQNNSILNGNDIVLIDTSQQVRSAYVYSIENMKEVIQHLSVLLPVEASKKIVLDR